MGCTQSTTAAAVNEPVVDAPATTEQVAEQVAVSTEVETTPAPEEPVAEEAKAKEFLIPTHSIENNVVLYHIQVEENIIKKRFNEFKTFHARVASAENVPALPEAGLFTAFKRRNEELIKTRIVRLEEILNAAPREEVTQFLIVEEVIVAAEPVADVEAAVEAATEQAVAEVASAEATVDAVVETSTKDVVAETAEVKETVAATEEVVVETTEKVEAQAQQEVAEKVEAVAEKVEAEVEKAEVAVEKVAEPVTEDVAATSKHTDAVVTEVEKDVVVASESAKDATVVA